MYAYEGINECKKEVLKSESIGLKEGVEPKQKAGDSTCCD